MLLLRAATASRMRDEDFLRQQEIAGTLTDDDTSDRAAVARGATLLHRAWGSANEARTKLRYTWHKFFKRFDVLLTPVAATAAFPHNRNPDRDERTVMVNGKQKLVTDVRFGAELTPTRNGKHRVHSKIRYLISDLAGTPMPYSVFFSGGQAVHYSPGFHRDGYNGASLGCVNVRVYKDAREIYQRTRIGTLVYVYRS